MSDLMTCEATRSAISSPALADGRVRFESPDGRMTDLFGPVPVLANLSPSQAKDLGLMTRDTSGLRGTGSSRSDALQSSLENRLRQRLTGSVSCDITWKRWDTPWGQCLSKPRAQVRSTFGIVVGLWPTMPSNAPARDGYNEAGNSAGQVAIRKILLALYPTATTPSGGQTIPQGTSMSGRRPDGSKAQVTLQNVVLAMWSTIRASDGEKGGPNMSFGAGGSPLPSQVSTVANTSNAPMESGGGSLHPEFAGWEMGYPPEWLSCAPSETPSTRARQRNLSARHSK
ncbi:hypothetical protein SAMN05192539_1001273 [Paraburkholderia diazotrophica]|uniref:Uncharacterized protein n=1 Tax=Paraburkholderia diazotrophica TaxID=667676 RepID=A0A1H6QDE0_9BURK|nr:hypothetical protein SAMN05192539_1001273 [Paraburkholderia diazotrophica]